MHYKFLKNRKMEEQDTEMQREWEQYWITIAAYSSVEVFADSFMFW